VAAGRRKLLDPGAQKCAASPAKSPGSGGFSGIDDGDVVALADEPRRVDELVHALSANEEHGLSRARRDEIGTALWPRATTEVAFNSRPQTGLTACGDQIASAYQESERSLLLIEHGHAGWRAYR